MKVKFKASENFVAAYRANENKLEDSREDIERTSDKYKRNIFTLEAQKVEAKSNMLKHYNMHKATTLRFIAIYLLTIYDGAKAVIMMQQMRVNALLHSLLCASVQEKCSVLAADRYQHLQFEQISYQNYEMMPKKLQILRT